MFTSPPGPLSMRWRGGAKQAVPTLLAILLLLAARLPAGAQDDPPSDTLLITPTTQGIFALPETGVTLEIAYATVETPTHITVTHTHEPESNVPSYDIAASDINGAPLRYFEMPLIAHLPTEGLTASRFPAQAFARSLCLLEIPAQFAYDEQDAVVTAVIGWPMTVAVGASLGSPLPWLIIFDAHGVYAMPTYRSRDCAVYLGPLEHFTWDMVQRDPVVYGEHFEALAPEERTIRATASNGDITLLPTAALQEPYSDRFIPEDLRNPGGFMLLGLADAGDVPDIVRALAGRIPPDPDIPAPGVPDAPIPLILPFDCTADWVISWGYHHSTPQNRFAVDFAALTPQGTFGQAVYAAHAGTVYLKRVGTPEHLIDTGFTARVVAADGITSTVYGHLDVAGTLNLWRVDDADLPDFEWVEVGTVDAGQIIGVAGATGYATGPHIHFALWSWDQSLYQPVPLGPLTEFPHGLQIPRGMRGECDVYR